MTLSTHHQLFKIPDPYAPAITRIAASTDHIPTVRLLNAPLHAITEQQTVQIVLDELDKGCDGSILTMNLDHLRRYRRDAFCRELYARASLAVADGMPLIWASRVQGQELPERVTGSNLIWSLSAGAAEAERTVFLLGGEPGTADDAAEVLRATYPDLKIVGTFCPDFGFESREEEMAAMADALISADPDIVFVALGTPKQDRLIESLRDYLPATWWVGVGISFSFVCGTVSRAPMWMQNTGLEWMHRLLQEPRRLAKRYLLNGLPFFGFLLADALGKRIFGRQ